MEAIIIKLLSRQTKDVHVLTTDSRQRLRSLLLYKIHLVISFLPNSMYAYHLKQIFNDYQSYNIMKLF